MPANIRKSLKPQQTNIEIIIRNNRGIKSRQWWLKIAINIKNLLIKHLPKKQKNLVKSFGLTILISNDTEIQNLNAKFRKKNKPTDVLSFYLDKKIQDKINYLGDIIISEETAKKQAKQKKISIEKELILLFIHGYLHLLGYDHIREKDKKIMFPIQDKVLNIALNEM